MTPKRMAIVIREAAYDRILTPLAFAWLGAASDIQVDLLFVNWAVRALKIGEAEKLRVSAEHIEQDAWLRQQVAAAGMPTSVYDILRALKETGRVRLYACSLAAQIFDVTSETLVPEADGILGATTFVLEHMAPADITMTF